MNHVCSPCDALSSNNALNVSHPRGASSVCSLWIKMVADFLASRHLDVHVQMEVTGRGYADQVLWQSVKHHHGGLKEDRTNLIISENKSTGCVSDDRFHLPVPEWTRSPLLFFSGCSTIWTVPQRPPCVPAWSEPEERSRSPPVWTRCFPCQASGCHLEDEEKN